MMAAAHCLAHDPDLPQLATVLDSTRMRQELARLLGLSEERVVDCAIERVRHKPGQSAAICYRLILDKADAKARRDLLVSSRLYPPGQSLARFHKASRDGQHTPVAGLPVMHAEPLDMLVWAYPNDRKLKGIEFIDDIDTLRTDVLPPLVASRWGNTCEIKSLEREIIHYVPEQGLTARVALELARAPGQRLSWRLYGKHFAGDEGSNTLRVMQELWDSPARRDGNLLLARPVAYQPYYRILWQEEIAGRALALKEDMAEWMQGAGAAISALHRTPITGLRHVRIADILQQLELARATLSRARPDVAAEVSAVVAGLKDRASRLAPHRPATLHGDLHPKNLIATDGGVGVIDLDNVALGPPLADIGSMCAALQARAVLEGAAPAQADRAISTFVSAYRTAGQIPFSDHDLAWHTAASLITERAYRCVTRAKGQRICGVQRLVALAGEVSRNEEIDSRS